MTDDPLTPESASIIVGVPTHQLRMWAYDRVGPRNIGTRHRPLYREEDLKVWLEQHAHPWEIHHAIRLD